MKLTNNTRYGVLFLLIFLAGGFLIYLLYDESFRMLNTDYIEIVKSEDYWTSENITIAINYAAESPRIRSFSIDGGKTWQREDSFVIEANGVFEITLRGTNGRVSKPLSFRVENIDKEGPVIEAEDIVFIAVGTRPNLTNIFNAYDELSGIHEVTVLADDLNIEVIGTYQIEVQATDLALNLTSKTITIEVVEANDPRLPTEEEVVAVAGLRVSIPRLNLVIGTNTVVLPFIRPSNATNQNVRWESLNKSVATVDADGRITAVRVGETVVRAITVDGNKISEIRVFVTNQPIEVRQISLDKFEEEVTTEVRTITLTATIDPLEATNQRITWSSSNPDVARVSEGIVTIRGEGNTTITATTSNGRRAIFHLVVRDNYTFQVTPNTEERGFFLRVFRNGVDITASITRITEPFELEAGENRDEIRLTMSQGNQIQEGITIYTTRRHTAIRQR